MQHLTCGSVEVGVFVGKLRSIPGDLSSACATKNQRPTLGKLCTLTCLIRSPPDALNSYLVRHMGENFVNRYMHCQLWDRVGMLEVIIVFVFVW